MSRKREKGYWLKRTEAYMSGQQAQERAAHLRQQEHISHVTVHGKQDTFEVSYSVAKWYAEELERFGLQLQEMEQCARY